MGVHIKCGFWSLAITNFVVCCRVFFIYKCISIIIIRGIRRWKSRDWKQNSHFFWQEINTSNKYSVNRNAETSTIDLGSWLVAKCSCWTDLCFKSVCFVHFLEPGYVSTPIAMVQAGLVILSEKDDLPHRYSQALYRPLSCTHHVLSYTPRVNRIIEYMICHSTAKVPDYLSLLASAWFTLVWVVGKIR